MGLSGTKQPHRGTPAVTLLGASLVVCTAVDVRILCHLLDRKCSKTQDTCFLYWNAYSLFVRLLHGCICNSALLEMIAHWLKAWPFSFSWLWGGGVLENFCEKWLFYSTWHCSTPEKGVPDKCLASSGNAYSTWHSPSGNRHSLLLAVTKGKGGSARQFLAKSCWTIPKVQYWDRLKHETYSICSINALGQGIPCSSLLTSVGCIVASLLASCLDSEMEILWGWSPPREEYMNKNSGDKY